MDIILDIETAPLTDEAAPEDALSPITGRIVGIGLKYLKEELIIIEQNEKIIIEQFWNKIGELQKRFSTLRFVGFNIVDFDYYFIVTRSLANNIKIIRQNPTSFIDLRQHLCIFKQHGKKGTLKEYAKLSGIEGKYLGLTGASIPLLWKMKHYDEIRNYLSADLRITEQLHTKCKELNIMADYENK